ncbi:MAG: tannase/feruloyl esterase family alpha/beta hydrolase [Bacteroidota bacterium]|nr:tannase/feruloyl esterase family alpha/beta hydrolase [Bacteroidota bacterium]
MNSIFSKDCNTSILLITKGMRFLVIFIFLLAGIEANAQANARIIQEVRELKLPGVTIDEIQDVSTGNFTLKDGQKITGLPSFLRVACTSRPSKDSNIRIEVWIPENNWNGRFLGTGNGGGAGWISYGALQSGVMRGFVTANTDMGTSPSAYEAVGHPEKWADFGYRSTHEMTVIAKAILQLYYKKTPYHSYFVGCSTGGQQALMEAQRYPEDYDGIIAGAPANNRTHLHASFIWNLKANNQFGVKPIISQHKMELLSKLVIKNCGGKDGGAPGDNFLTDPRIIKFEYLALPQCPNDAQTDSCFSEAEINALKKIYSGPINPRTGERIYSPLPLGSAYLESTAPHLYLINWVFGKDYDFEKFDFDHDMEKVDSVLAPLLNANDPNLDRLKKRGGKILMYTGTADQLVEFEDALNYYERVIEKQKGLKETQNFFRFFLVPGMGHCGGGPGLTEFGQGLSRKVVQDGEHDILTAMINWVEKKIAPEKMIATAFNCCDEANKVDFQRPIYPYPKFPKYINGDIKSPYSFQGSDHLQGGVLVPDKIYLK